MSESYNQKDTSPPAMLTVTEVASLFHVHPNTVRQWSDTGLIKVYRIGHRRDRRFKVEDIDEYLMNNGGNTSQ